MSVVLEINDAFNGNERECGRIFLSIKEVLVFQCTLCKENFVAFAKYRNHIKRHHYPNCKDESEDELFYKFNEPETLSPETLVENTISENCLDQSNQILEVQVNVLEEAEVDIKTLKKAKDIKVLNATNHNKEKRQPQKRNCAIEKESTVCPICKEILSKNTHLKTHMRRHTNEKDYKCSICSKAFYTRWELDTHLRSHTGERPYLCTSCGMAFTTASKLKAHINQNHIRQRDKQCSLCNMKFYSSVILKNHMITHSDERPFACEVCASKFKQKKGLQSHMKMHENRKEHICDLCSARFNQKCNLNSHRKMKHSIASDNREFIFNT